MSLTYLDTSCLLKLLLDEPESPEARQAVDTERKLVISSLVELEAEVQLKALAVGGQIRSSQWGQYQAQLIALRNLDPFHFRHLPASVFTTALRQHRHPQATQCRSLDRLHLAAMEELKISTIMTLDDVQAKVARALKLHVSCPGR